MELDLWRPLAGLALFLFAMTLIEAALRGISGKALQQFLTRNTEPPLRGIISGTVTTAVLQSSSLVGLMMLAFVGAGVLRMRSALAVIFGSNLGTTATGWIVATIGFKLDLEAFALPLVAIGGLTMVTLQRRKGGDYGRLCLGLGLLLTGLAYMKGAVGDVSALVDETMLADFNAVEFLLFGVVFSALVQSSSATMMVTLSALHAGMIDLPAAAAIAIGADLGTTGTVLLGAFRGSAAKKRVALGHFIFNLVTDLLAFALRLPLLALVSGFSDPLLTLVAFHSAFNLAGIVLFTPVIGSFADFLERRFRDDRDDSVNRYLRDVSDDVPEAALPAVRREVIHLIVRVIRQNLMLFELPPPNLGPTLDTEPIVMDAEDFVAAYETTKRLEGEILAVALALDHTRLTMPDREHLGRYLDSARDAVHASKILKDVRHDLSGSGPAGVARFREQTQNVYGALAALSFETESSTIAGEIVEAMQALQHWHRHSHDAIYRDIRDDAIGEEEASSVLNVNRALYVAHSSLFAALRDILLEPEPAEVVSRVVEAV